MDLLVLLLDADLAPNPTGVAGVVVGLIAGHRGLV
jgi:hypothetical protein